MVALQRRLARNCSKKGGLRFDMGSSRMATEQLAKMVCVTGLLKTTGQKWRFQIGGDL